MIRVVGAERPTFDLDETVAQRNPEFDIGAETQREVLGGVCHGDSFVTSLVPGVVGHVGLNKEIVAHGVGETGHVDQSQPIVA